MKIDDPVYVERQYATEHALAARKSLYDEVAGDDAREHVLTAVREVAPAAVLEVGCGEGELAKRLQTELGATVTAIDQSPRMVELARARGVDARVGDVQDLSFADGAFDVAVAAWVLFHVPSLDRAVGELARVLRGGGRLVAVTNYADHLLELFELADALDERFELTFGAENGGDVLARYFDHVQRREAIGSVTIRDARAIRRYLESSERLAPFADHVPELGAPVVARRHQAVFVAEKAP